MIAELAGQQFLVDVATAVGALLVVTSALAAAARLRPVRWLARTLIGRPLTEWLRRELREEVAPIIAELRPNGGSSARDALDRLERSWREDEEERLQRQQGLDERLDRIEGVLVDVRPIIDDWRRSHPEIRPDSDDDSGQT